MIDTHVGTTYQVQWYTESNKRFRKLIHQEAGDFGINICFTYAYPDNSLGLKWSKIV